MICTNINLTNNSQWWKNCKRKSVKNRKGQIPLNRNGHPPEAQYKSSCKSNIPILKSFLRNMLRKYFPVLQPKTLYLIAIFTLWNLAQITKLTQWKARICSYLPFLVWSGKFHLFGLLTFSQLRDDHIQHTNLSLRVLIYWKKRTRNLENLIILRMKK